jgi:hypothetical protein
LIESRPLKEAQPELNKTLLAAVVMVVLCALKCSITREGIVVELTPGEIQERLDKAFPISQTYLMVFDLTLSDPEVSLTEGSDRIGFGLSAKTNVRVDGEDVTGRAHMTTGIEYDPKRGALLLADPRVEALKLSMLPEKYEDEVLAAANIAAKKFLREYEVYRLDEADFKQALAKMVLKDVVVRDGVLKMIFGPGNR